VFTPQDESKVTIISKLNKTDGFLDFSDSAVTLDRKIRGLYPWPGASANYLSKQNGKVTRVIIASAEVIDQYQNPQAKFGTLDENLNIICSHGLLGINRIKPAGGALMDFRDFVNGHRTVPGDMFVKIEE
ncbi:MAG: hypothetical protein E4H40_01220, partial [Candidatus Brocadiia bacterium]